MCNAAPRRRQSLLMWRWPQTLASALAGTFVGRLAVFAKVVTADLEQIERVDEHPP